MPRLGLSGRSRPVGGKILLIACSARKRRFLAPAKAKHLYAGGLLRLALRLARAEGMRPLILSAKYGIVSPEQELEWYNQKLAEPYTGPWPDGDGYWVGSELYFSKAPKRFRRLVPSGLPIGKQLAYLKQLIAKGIPA